ncbi:hypothetical protein MKX01_034508 [Papaver californicum]|nr:hypothetical protein MKX01_034508 [Papaver californicum]
MATSRVGRFVMEVAPPQFVSVMQRRTSKMLDTIVEEDHRDVNFTTENNLSLFSSSKFSSSSSSSSSSFPMAKQTKTILTSSSSSSNYFINDANRSSSIYGF